MSCSPVAPTSRRRMLQAGAGSLLLPAIVESASLGSGPAPESTRQALDEALDSGAQISALRAIAIARNGQHIAGRLYGRTAADTLFRVHSATKSISSMLVGIALAQGRLLSLSQTLGELLPEAAAAHPDSAARDVTLSQVLTGTTGLAYDWTTDIRPLADARDPVQYAFALPRNSPSARAWSYNDAAVGLLAPILERAYGTSMHEAARANLFAPLGIDKFDWQRDRTGRVLAYGGLRLQIGDFLKLAWVIADGGRWHGTQVVPSDWVVESTRAHVQGAWPNPPIENSGYGYLWFTGIYHGVPLAWAWGYGAQFALVAPSRRLAVVTAATEPPPHQLAAQNQAVATVVARVLDTFA